ncbi:MJ0042-type zinc finger domain-containing protein [uncultured Gimesia sp.]|uniref:MJ0042-type zinc finger domain-containing protein n=1 Tax=uncultured Gimesia sp. TaxID=1678688 RepID=UPI0030D6FCC1|tara:strand:+ start:329859 stop:331577 length:1719 start_codon:yes stop_codon:yes gene_type:complete
MPIKVRCKECDASFSVKDEAAGKRVRCKGCGAPIKVSAGQPKKKRRSSSDSADTDDFLASFDIDKIEDKESKICPRCGYDVDDEDIECTNCGVDLSTGRMSEATRRRRKRKGPAVEEFYSKSWGDAYRFLGNHKGLAIKTAVYSVIASCLFLGSIFMMLWCHRTPPRAFWGFIAFVSIMAIPGWIWFIQTEVVRFALQKKDKLKRINFDFFLCSALGIKFILWTILFSLPAQAIFGSLGFYYISNDSSLIGTILIAIGFIPTFLMFPLAMPHMTMLDTTPGWMPHKMGKIFLVLFKPAIFWCLVFLITNLPAIGCLAGIGAVYGNDLNKFFSNVRYNSTVAADNSAKEWADENKIKDFQDGPMVGKTPAELEPKVLIAPSVLWLLACIFYAPAMIYNARVNGLLALHSKPDLGLITKISETKYVSKTEREENAPTTARWQLATIGVLAGSGVGTGLYFLIPMLPEMLLYVLIGIFGLTNLGCFGTTLVKIKQVDGVGQCVLGFFISLYAYGKGWAYAAKDKEMGTTMLIWTLSLIAGNILVVGMDQHGLLNGEEKPPAANAPAEVPADEAAP